MLRMRYIGGFSDATKEQIKAAKMMRMHGNLPGGSRKVKGAETSPAAKCAGLGLLAFAVVLIIIAVTNGHNPEPAKFKPLEEVRWGIIGCGDVTEMKSGPALSLIPHSRLIHVMRRNASRAEDYARRHSVPMWTTSAQELISNPSVNAIYVATPPKFHGQYVVMAAKAGKPVYVEKPMGRSFQEGKALADAARREGMPVFPAYYRRALPKFMKIKQLLDEGVIGTVRSVRVEYYRSPNKHDYDWAAAGGASLPPGASLLNSSLSWRPDPDVGGKGGYLRDKASHQFDLLDYWFGHVVSLYGSASNQAGLYPAEDTAFAQFKFANGVVGTGSWSFVAGPDSYRDFGEIVGSRGRLRFSFFASNKVQIWNTSDYRRELELPTEAHVQKPLLEMVVDALRGKGNCPSTAESAIRTSRVIDYIVEGIHWP